MKNEGKFLIYVNPTHYWELDLMPIPNEFQEPINKCVLINSKTSEVIESIAFNAEYIIPILQTRNQSGFKEIALTLKELADKKGIITTPRNDMPQDKRIKETKKIGKRRV